ncbi:hypothetical protein KIL84_013539 [Mauremys mutica]|uniref:V-type proton ATPase subunit S1 luminal domain-containing protein n=1 Tax=Mauremys mutica TaxID=74926 RepID=A0A9D3WVL4_9SAUR|nr:hypothetical protein KIL84_013539 [Mauremys mutica]
MRWPLALCPARSATAAPWSCRSLPAPPGVCPLHYGRGACSISAECKVHGEGKQRARNAACSGGFASFSASETEPPTERGGGATDPSRGGTLCPGRALLVPARGGWGLPMGPSPWDSLCLGRPRARGRGGNSLPARPLTHRAAAGPSRKEKDPACTAAPTRRCEDPARGGLAAPDRKRSSGAETVAKSMTARKLLSGKLQLPQCIAPHPPGGFSVSVDQMFVRMDGSSHAFSYQELPQRNDRRYEGGVKPKRNLKQVAITQVVSYNLSRKGQSERDSWRTWPHSPVNVTVNGSPCILFWARRIMIKFKNHTQLDLTEKTFGVHATVDVGNSNCSEDSATSAQSSWTYNQGFGLFCVWMYYMCNTNTEVNIVCTESCPGTEFNVRFNCVV